MDGKVAYGKAHIAVGENNPFIAATFCFGSSWDRGCSWGTSGRMVGTVRAKDDTSFPYRSGGAAIPDGRSPSPCRPDWRARWRHLRRCAQDRDRRMGMGSRVQCAAVPASSAGRGERSETIKGCWPKASRSKRWRHSVNSAWHSRAATSCCGILAACQFFGQYPCGTLKAGPLDARADVADSFDPARPQAIPGGLAGILVAAPCAGIHPDQTLFNHVAGLP